MNDLKPDQLTKVAAATGRQVSYLARLLDRMRVLGFPADDQLYVAVSRAWEATSNLTVVAATAAHKVAPRANHSPTIMEKHPWGGDPSVPATRPDGR